MAIKISMVRNNLYPSFWLPSTALCLYFILALPLQSAKFLTTQINGIKVKFPKQEQ